MWVPPIHISVARVIWQSELVIKVIIIISFLVKNNKLRYHNYILFLKINLIYYKMFKIIVLNFKVIIDSWYVI